MHLFSCFILKYCRLNGPIGCPRHPFDETRDLRLFPMNFNILKCSPVAFLTDIWFCFKQVTEEEVKAANQTYNGLSDMVLRALPDAPLQPLLVRLGRSGNSTISAKAWLRAADPALRDVIAKEALQFKKGHVSQVNIFTSPS